VRGREKREREKEKRKRGRGRVEEIEEGGKERGSERVCDK
jgi:hypothetical protein